MKSFLIVAIIGVTIYLLVKKKTQPMLMKATPHIGGVASFSELRAQANSNKQ